MSESNHVTSFPVDPNLDFANQALAATATNTYTFRYDSSVEGGVKVEHISDGFHEFLGYDPEKYAEFLNPMSVVHEEDIPILKAKSEANQRGEGTIATARVVVAGGEIKWIKIVSVPRRDADGTLRVFNATFDVTAEKKSFGEHPSARLSFLRRERRGDREGFGRRDIDVERRRRDNLRLHRRGDDGAPDYADHPAREAGRRDRDYAVNA